MKNLKSLVVIGAVLATALVASGTTIYDDLTANPIPDPNSVLGLTNNQMVGDQITLGNTAAPYLNDFQIEYYSSNLTAYAGSVTMDVRFYFEQWRDIQPLCNGTWQHLLRQRRVLDSTPEHILSRNQFRHIGF